MLRLPNLPHESVPIGKTAEDNPVVRVHGEKPAFAFKPKSHVELCESLKLVDFARGAKLSGSGFLLYTNWGARLERALIQFLLDLHTTSTVTPRCRRRSWSGRNAWKASGSFPSSRTSITAWRKGDDNATLGKLYLIPTAETPVANIHREEILQGERAAGSLLRLHAVFSRRGGAAGVGTRGMIRVHQFDKVELIKIVKPENGYDELEKMVANAERVLQLLGLHYRVVLLCTGDMGFAQRQDLRHRSVGAGAGELSGSVELLELRGFPGAPDEPAVQGGVGRKQIPAHPERQRHGAGAAVRGAGGDAPAGRRQRDDSRAVATLSENGPNRAVTKLLTANFAIDDLTIRVLRFRHAFNSYIVHSWLA